MAAAALELVDQHGIEALSIRRVAQAVGVAGPSLYWHFRDKNELIDLVTDAALGQVSLDHDGTPRAWIEQLAHSYRDVLRTHPGLATLIAQRLPTGPNALAIYDRSIANFLAAGLDASDAIRLHGTIAYLVLSSVQREGPNPRADNHMLPAPDVQRLQHAIADDPARNPTLAALAAQRPDPLDITADELLDYGLDLILDGANLPR